MITVKEFFCKAAKVGSELECGIYTFSLHKAVGTGRVTVLGDYRLNMEGSYDIDEEFDGHVIKGKGNYKASLHYEENDKKWYIYGEMDGVYAGRQTMPMEYRFEENYHIFEGYANNYLIKAQTWNKSDKDFYVYATVTPQTTSLPSFYIRMK